MQTAYKVKDDIDICSEPILLSPQIIKYTKNWNWKDKGPKIYECLISNYSNNSLGCQYG